MNRVLVRKVTAGLAAYLKATVPDAATRGVVIGHDARHNSRVFAEDTARVLAGAGIKVLPRASAVADADDRVGRHRSSTRAAGVMVTASHNPPEYNGYKVYWGNGAQIIPPHDTGIAADDRARSAAATSCRCRELAERARSGLVVDLDEIAARQLPRRRRRAARAARSSTARDLIIAYTPLHGVGAPSVEPALERAGFPRVHTEPTQREARPGLPDGRVPEPRGEGRDGSRARARAPERTPTSCSRTIPTPIGCASPSPTTARYRVLTGDQVGALLADYLLEVGPKDKRMVATTIVSSQLLVVPREASRRRLPRDAHRLQVDRQRARWTTSASTAAASSWATRKRSATRSARSCATRTASRRA